MKNVLLKIKDVIVNIFTLCYKLGYKAGYNQCMNDHGLLKPLDEKK